MLDKRLQEITRPELSIAKKIQIFEDITSCDVINGRNRYILPQVVMLMTTTVVIIVLLFTLMTTNVRVIDEPVVGSNLLLQDIVKATSLANDRPEKMINVTSLFYREKLVSTNREKLAVYEELFKNVEVEPFSWDGLRVNPDTTDYLFELADGRNVYLKTFTVIDGGDFYIVNPQTMERYVLDYGGQFVFSDTWQDVFAVEMKGERWPIIIISALVYFIYRRMRGKPIFDKVEQKDLMPGWLSVALCGFYGIVFLWHEWFFGAVHAGFIIVLTTVFVFMFLYIQKRFFSVQVSNGEFVQTIIVINLLLGLIFW